MTYLHLLSGRVKIALLLGCLLLLLAACGTSSSSQTSTAPSSFQTTLKTSDQKFLIRLNITPNSFGENTFTVIVRNADGSNPTTPLNVRLQNTMLEMNMGVDTINLQPNSKGQYSAQDYFDMGGSWEVDINVQTPDQTLHTASVRLVVAD